MKESRIAIRIYIAAVGAGGRVKYVRVRKLAKSASK